MIVRTHALISMLSLITALSACKAKPKNQSQIKSVTGTGYVTSNKLYAYEYRFSSQVIGPRPDRLANASCLYTVLLRDGSNLFNDPATRFSQARPVTVHAVDNTAVYYEAQSAFYSTSTRLREVLVQLWDDELNGRQAQNSATTNTTNPQQNDEQAANIEILSSVVEIFKRHEMTNSEFCPFVHPRAQGGGQLPAFTPPNSDTGNFQPGPTDMMNEL